MAQTRRSYDISKGLGKSFNAQTALKSPFNKTYTSIETVRLRTDKSVRENSQDSLQRASRSVSPQNALMEQSSIKLNYGSFGQPKKDLSQQEIGPLEDVKQHNTEQN